ncbi:regulatory protein NPR3-like [Cynara cardunculus var. scolymus]|uniref:Ankyrin repeat-containing protein n=1 Tax=Cynara cardunculus var. scolymus TaxID=59895 RepID=A0A103XJP8_CYNCS|nr:regulatory protein NPR3-like [Cynara cardunculus var. scolymus]KVH92028.1 Ankyrin repeat-containing protein [Cynara cardunculus var. scolymus]
MANSSEPSSSISFTSSSLISNGSTNYNIPSSSIPEPRANLEILSLNKLSTNLEKLLADSDSESNCNYSDAEVVVEGISVGIHRCILATRSKFFSDLFKDGKSKYIMSNLLPYGNVGHDAFLVFLSYVYTGKLKSSPPEVSTCVDDGCRHDACRPAISFAVELTYASSVFQVPELVSLFQRHLLNFVDKALVEDVIPILTVAFHCQLEHVLTRCIDRVSRSNLDNVSLEKELPFEVAQNVKSLRSNSLDDDEHTVESEGALREKRIKSIHKALDCDDVELVKLILSESQITLDEACALHYAVSYCDKEVAKMVLDLNQANVNLRNSRGYTVLHVAAMRKEPSIIVSLLSKGAAASDITVDGQSAVSICRRLTRPKDYHAKMEHGQETNKDRICIDVLEREIKRNPMIGNVSACSSAVADDLHMKLLYLENRVAFARLLFPSEAKLAMEIAHAQTTSEFPGLLASKGSNGNLREMDLNETPLVQNKRLLLRMEALSKTVETGRRYFPHCSEVLDKFMDDDLPDLFFLEKGTADEQEIKRTRFVELKEEVQRAFTKDKAELHRGLSSSMYYPTTRGKNKSRRYS